MRDAHVYIPGATRHGKSTLMERMILSDIHIGAGVGVLDPKADLLSFENPNSLLHKIPEHRVGDTIYLNVSSPVPLDLMSWETQPERNRLARELTETFFRFCPSSAEGARWPGILKVTIHTLLAAKHCSFLDIHYFHTHPDKKAQILARVRKNNIEKLENGKLVYDDILHYWDVEYDAIPKHSEIPITGRTTDFIHDPALNIMLGTPDALLNISWVIENRKILLVNLAGVTDANMVGTLIVNKFQQAAYRRISQPPHERIPFFLFADEFERFQTTDFDDILSQAGGLKLCLTLANQGLYQLTPKILASINTNVTGAYFIFRVHPNDAKNYRHLLGDFDVSELSRLPRHHALHKIGTFRPIIKKTKPPVRTPPVSYAESIRNRTMVEYGYASCKAAADKLGLWEDAPPDPPRAAAAPPGRPQNIPAHRGKK